MICKICESENKEIFKGKVLNKHQVSYYKCPNCDFIQTEDPYWLNEAYSDAIAELDVGLVYRNTSFSGIVSEVIKNNFNQNGRFLDYAGGYGLFVRLMRDRGFDFYREDKYCENIFAKCHDVESLGSNEKFELITAFEVFEHLVNPIEDIKNIFNYGDTLIFSTELQPSKEISGYDDWWYFVPETGQHISFYSEKTLKYIANKFGFSFYSSPEHNLYLFSKGQIEINPFVSLKDNGNNVELKSLIEFDFDFAKKVVAEKDKLDKEISNEKSDRKIILENKLSIVSTRLNNVEDELSARNKELLSTKDELSVRNKELLSTKDELSARNAELLSTKHELALIHSSLGWRMIKFLYRLTDFLLPIGSRRRNIVSRFWRFLLLVKNTHLFDRRRNYKELKLNKRRKINTNSKKIVYIGHSYHDKTKSTKFLIDYLKEFYEVEVILDESWLGKPFPDLSFIDESYLGVVFFQNLPGPEVLQNIKNDNIVFFPMYDALRTAGLSFWRRYDNLKIVNFSKTLNDKLVKWGFNSVYLQYFPKPNKFIPGDKKEVFFWQRIGKININVISKLFSNGEFRIHIHKSVDPEHEFINPSEDLEKRFHITFSEWFEKKEDMLSLIKQKGVYIAPRELEGIGMSFLEAMAMGKAVVAVDNPTMNEYIRHNETGYLFDISSPEKIDFSNIEKVQKKTYDFMCRGYKKWEKEKGKIIDFIKKTN